MPRYGAMAARSCPAIDPRSSSLPFVFMSTATASPSSGNASSCAVYPGTVPGYTAQLLAFPEEGLAVAVLMNTNGNEGQLASIAGQLRAALAP